MESVHAGMLKHDCEEFAGILAVRVKGSGLDSLEEVEGECGFCENGFGESGIYGNEVFNDT